jgi:hypothetical protein
MLYYILVNYLQFSRHGILLIIELTVHLLSHKKVKKSCLSSAAIVRRYLSTSTHLIPVVNLALPCSVHSKAVESRSRNLLTSISTR